MKRSCPYTLLVNCVANKGRSVSEVLVFGWVLACIGSGVNNFTVDFGADINTSHLVGNDISLSGT